VKNNVKKFLERVILFIIKVEFYRNNIWPLPNQYYECVNCKNILIK